MSAFASLVVVDVIVYSAALILEFVALIVLRIKYPKMKRPYRVPGGWLGIFLITILPIGVIALAIFSTIQEEGISAIYLSVIAIASGPILYPILKKYIKKGQPDVEVPIDEE